jgi:hypothetical protein
MCYRVTFESISWYTDMASLYWSEFSQALRQAV